MPDNRFMSIGTPLKGIEFVPVVFEGTEALGRPFQFFVEVLSDKEPDHTKLIGENVTVRIRQGDGKDRLFNGYVSRFVNLPRNGRMFRSRMTLVPWLWFFTRQADCRLFHAGAAVDLLKKVKVPEIVQEIWKDAGFNHYKSQLQTEYPERELTVQYRETTFNFFSRLMEHEGIYYYFEHEDGKHSAVLCDSPSNHEVREGAETLLWDPTEEGVTGAEHVSEWVIEREMHATKTALADYDFTKPNTPLSEVGAFPREIDPVYEVFDAPGDFLVKEQGERLANTRAQELGSQYMTIHGAGNIRNLGPGQKFSLSGPVRPDQKGEFLCLAASYRAANDIGDSGKPVAGSEAFSCTFTVRAAADQFRPARTTPVPVISGPQTAVVVGADGDEIHTDQEGYGRVKVKFHWDRYSKADQNASPWIRVAQVWAGKKWGSMFTPRVGHEVVVDFLDGDPDRPLVAGRVYNNENMPAYELPANKTMSYIKSSSSTGGEGFNELRFEDKAGEEQVFIHAQKNMDVRVLNDAFDYIGHNKHLQVEVDNHVWIKNDSNVKIDRDHKELIARDRNLKVDGKEAKEVTKSLSLKVGEDVIEEFAKNHSEVVTKDLYLKADNICLEAATNITIKVGDQYVAINSDGVKIGSKGKIAFEATGEVSMKSTGADVKVESGAGELSLKGTTGLKADGTAQAEVKGAKASVEGQSMLELKGGMVKIG